VLVDDAMEVVLVDEGVVSFAQQSGVVQVGAPAAAPPAQVVDVAPGGGTVQAG